MLTGLLLDTLVTGLPYVLPFLGVFVVFRLLERIDLTIDASFTLGAAVATTSLGTGAPAALSLVAAVLAGAGAGLATTGLHLLMRVPVLFAGIVMWIGLYSVSLRIMGRPTLAVEAADTIYAPFGDLGRSAQDALAIATLAVVVMLVLVALDRFLRTETGLALRAVGVNTPMARSQGVDDRRTVALGLALANALAGLGGALVAQGQGFAEINMGTGVLIAGVAAVLLGELLTRARGATIVRGLLAVLAGTLTYRIILLSALRAGLPAADLRLVTALTMVTALLVQRVPLDRLQGSTRRRQTAQARHRRGEDLTRLEELTNDARA